LLAVSALLIVAASTPAQAQQSQNDLGVSVDLREEVRDGFIFVFANNVPTSQVGPQANALARANGGRVTRVYTSALKGFAAKMTASAASRLATQNPNIDYYEPDGLAFAFRPPSWAGGGDSTVTSCDPQQTPWGVTRVGGPINGTGLTAWVIDTGIDQDHPDLNVDTGMSANFVSHGKDSPDDGNGHGTHVAGTIAAIDNGCDVVGVAAGATVVAVRVLDNSGSGSWSGVIAGIDYVAANAAPGDVANMSLGGGYNQAVNDAVKGASSGGIWFSVAAGNSEIDAGNYSPASANGPFIYTVSAIDSSDVFAWFSNFGNPPVDCAAPGVSVVSSKRGGGTTIYSGTSMAAPHVAGLLLFGPPNFDGTARNDPDGNPDSICHD